jgi:hypothetical protein
VMVADCRPRSGALPIVGVFRLIELPELLIELAQQPGNLFG